jgi:hypothetical protein
LPNLRKGFDAGAADYLRETAKVRPTKSDGAEVTLLTAFAEPAFQSLTCCKSWAQKIPRRHRSLGAGEAVSLADAALAPPWPELLSVLPHDRSHGLQTNADATAVMT